MVCGVQDSMGRNNRANKLNALLHGVCLGAFVNARVRRGDSGVVPGVHGCPPLLVPSVPSVDGHLQHRVCRD